MHKIFSPFKIRDLTINNRVVMSPMSQGSADNNGVANPWHIVHYGSRAVGGVGLIMMEDTGIVPEGRIKIGALGLYDKRNYEPLKSIVDFCHSQGSKIGIQLAHSGPKAWGNTNGAGPTLPSSPSGVPYSKDFVKPTVLEKDDIRNLVSKWQEAAQFAADIGFDCVEIHAAHGYLLNAFLSPLTNHRVDEYGKDKSKFLLEVVNAVRKTISDSMPLFVRLSASDLHPKGLLPDDIAVLGSRLASEGVDVFDLSWGGISPDQIRLDKGEMIDITRYIRETSGVPVVSVGLTNTWEDAEFLLESGVSDLVGIGRSLIRDPYWVLHTAETLSVPIEYPKPYSVAFQSPNSIVKK